MTYSLLNAAFLVVPAVLALLAIVRLQRSGRLGGMLSAIGIALAVVLVLTAIFDNVLVGLGIVGYDDARTLGLRIGVAPIEDFAYAVAAAIGLPSLWILLRREPR